MSDTEFNVVIAAYLIPDLAEKDFDALVRLVGDKQLKVEGVALVTNDADGNVTVKETGDHLGRCHRPRQASLPFTTVRRPTPSTRRSPAR